MQDPESFQKKLDMIEPSTRKPARTSSTPVSSDELEAPKKLSKGMKISTSLESLRRSYLNMSYGTILGDGSEKKLASSTSFHRAYSTFVYGQVSVEGYAKRFNCICLQGAYFSRFI